MATDFAVLHYQHMARQAAALRSAQIAWDNRLPPEVDDDEPSLDVQTDAVIEVIGRACRTFDKTACRDLLREAAAMLETLADEVEA